MTNKKYKVLLFLFGGVGGAERMTVNIGKMLPRDRYEVKFVVCGRFTEILKFIPSDYDVIRIQWHNIYVFPRLRMGYVIFKERPDFVFSSTMALNILLIQVSGLFKIKCIVRNDNMLSFASPKLFRKMSKWYPHAHHIVAQQEEMYDELIRMIPLKCDQVVTLHNVIDRDTISKKLENADNPFPNDNSLNYVWVGRINEKKGQDILIKALYLLRKNDSRAHVYFVGPYDEKSAYYKQLQSLINEYQLNGYVHFVGYDTNPYRWVKHCDCFVLPSRLEGLPNALIEAQYIGRPCVATECIPMIKRIIAEGSNGYTVPTEDAEAMAAAMRKALLLGNIKMTYQPSSVDEFIHLFN